MHTLFSTQYGDTALTKAFRNGHLHIAEFMLKYGPTKEQQDEVMWDKSCYGVCESKCVVNCGVCVKSGYGYCDLSANILRYSWWFFRVECVSLRI